VTRIASVASFFVSRVDTLVDRLLEEKRAAGDKVDHLLGKAANANAKVAYARFGEVFGKGGAFDELAARGARVQRPLWASTSSKNPDYPDTIYVDLLIGPHTVNTLPPHTIEAVLDHGATKSAIQAGLAEARAALGDIAALGIDLGRVTDQLESDGVASFAKSFDELLENLAAKQHRLSAAR
jgi:transaldolase